MPLFFPAIAIFIVLSFFINRRIKESHRLAVYSCMTLVVWASVVYQFVHIFKYIDATGERITEILGSSGLAFSWIGLIVISLLMLLLLTGCAGQTAARTTGRTASPHASPRRM